jgi:hypothetical protein
MKNAGDAIATNELSNLKNSAAQQDKARRNTLLNPIHQTGPLSRPISTLSDSALQLK